MKYVLLITGLSLTGCATYTQTEYQIRTQFHRPKVLFKNTRHGTYQCIWWHAREYCTPGWGG